MLPIFICSYLVLEYEDDALGEKYGVCPLAHSWNGELKEKVALRSRRCEELEAVDLLQPSLALLWTHVEMMPNDQLP
jgi:hypothetical protein